MAREKDPFVEPSEVPYLGALPHLEWLSQLSVPEGVDARAFLEQTGAVPSLARFIHRHRSVWPNQYQQRFVFDTRQIALGKDWRGVFHGAVDVAPQATKDVAPEREDDTPLPPWAGKGAYPRQVLSIYGRPNPGTTQGFDYEYSLVIPVQGTTYRFDPDRQIQATLSRGSIKDIRYYEVMEYNEVASPDSGRADPDVLIFAIQHAAHDILRIIHHVNGSDKERPLDALPVVPVSWSKDYLDDDPDEFIKLEKVT